MKRLPFLCLVALLTACGDPPPAPRPEPLPLPTAPAPAATRPVEAPPPTRAATPAAPALLNREPRIGIWLQGSAKIVLTLAGPAELPGGHRLPAGSLTAEAAGDGIRCGGRTWPSPLEFAPAGGFKAEAEPADGGKPRHLACAGAVRLSRTGRELELIEVLPIEDYLPSVVATEMRPDWPDAALAAQAVVARSYALWRAQTRANEPWQLHWHYVRDMAYGGSAAAVGPGARAAVQRTRGLVLLWQGWTVPALFHACSGGRTESVANAVPRLAGEPGAPAVGVAEDPAAEAGAAGLRMTATHWRWTARIPLSEVGAALRTWSRRQGRPLALGAVRGFAIAARQPDSGRVATVRVRHHQPSGTEECELPAYDVRLALGAGEVRSLWWDRCAIEDRALVISGRGYGHGAGLSQVSAWQLARDGLDAESIVRRFYPGAELRRLWP